MKLKQMTYKKIMIIACLLAGLQGTAFAMHFDKGDIAELIKGLSSGDAENMREAIKASKVSDYQHHYPMHYVIMRGNFDAVQEIINWLDVNEEDNEGKTPLYVAAFYKNIKLINLLLEHGADPAKVLNHSSKFLEKNGYEKINELLDGTKKQISADDSSVSVKPLKSKPKKKRFISKKLTEQTIKELLAYIQKQNIDGVYFFSAYINKLINNNDINGLKALLKNRNNEELMLYVRSCLKDGNILLLAIKNAARGDYRMVELLLAETSPDDITEDNLAAYYVAAREKNDNALIQIIVGLVEVYYPMSTILQRCKVYKCKKVIIPSSNKVCTPEELKKIRLMSKKPKAIASLCLLGAATLGLICYQLFKNDQIHKMKKLM